MAEYKVYQNAAGDLHKVKVGFSFPGFFFGGIWMVVARLWDILAIALITAFILSTLIAFLSPETNISISGGMALSIVAGIHGNSWIERRLKKSGYTLVHDTRFVKKTDVDAIEGSLIGEIWKGNTSAVLRMIEAGVDINQTNAAGQTALDAASIRGDIATVLMLLSKGAVGRVS